MAEDCLSEDWPSETKDKNARGQSQGPRRQVQVFPKNKNKRFSIFFSADLQTFNGSKTSSVLEPRTGEFSRTWGFEAKAKDLTLEAKAKGFKVCPRDQGRPPGLNL